LRPPPRQIRFVLLLIVALVRPLAAATASRGMVSAEHELAAKAGVEMLERGGNAVDAAVAAAFATGVVNPSSCGIGGGGFALVHEGKTHQAHFVDFRETAPAAATSDMYVRNGRPDSNLSLHGALAIAVPGEVRGLARVLRDFGTLPLATVLAPAIRLAAQGFPVGNHLAEELSHNAEQIRRHPALAAVYLKPSGEPYAAGETLVQRDLAATLRAIAVDGPRVFYEGAIGDAIAKAVAAESGILATADLRGYRERLRKPLTTRYRGLTVIAAPPPGSGGVVLEILNVLGGYDLRREGAHSVFAFHRIAKAEALAFRDRAQSYGDPDFVEVPISRLLSSGHAEALRRQIAAATPAAALAPAEKGGTAHTSAMDVHGNAAAVTTTVNTAFGSMVLVPGTGIILNNEMDDFSSSPGVPNVYGLIGSEANAIRGGKRPLSSMSPTLLLRKGTPLLAIGASGGPRIITSTLLTIVNLIDFGMDLERAVAAPRIHDQAFPARLFYEPALDPTIVAGLRALGHELVEAHDLGAVQAVLRNGTDLVGVADPRKGGAAVGW
jgi:gamma-glutamyltranspeptidase/glutathione hydrolase